MGGCEQRLGGRTARRRFFLKGGVISKGWSPSIKRERISVGSLDLPPGYYAERGETGVYLMDPDGRRVMRFSSDVASAGEHQETTRLKPSAKPGPEEWQELCRSLLIRLSQKNSECERLSARVEELVERLEAAEAERDQANAIAEDLYGFFRNRVRETVDRRERSGRRRVH